MINKIVFVFSILAPLSIASCKSSPVSSVKGNGCSRLSVQTTEELADPKQQEYERLFDRAVMLATQRLQKGASFYEVDEFLGMSRQAIQKKVHPKDGNIPLFGIQRAAERGEILSTPFTERGIYQGGWERIAQVLAGKKSYGLKRGDYGDQLVLDVHARSVVDPNKSYLLTQIMGYPDRRPGQFMLPGFRSIKGPFAAVLHSSPEFLDELMKELAHLYQIALRPASDEAVLDAIATFHWWYSHVTPKVRGSASIGKMHVAVLLKAHHLNAFTPEDLHRFYDRQGLDLDVWALTSGDSRAYRKAFVKALQSKRKMTLP